ncbi:unnamed protein product, partial [Ranitomeya imitator]
IVTTSPPCQTYQVAVDEANCTRLKTGSYDCTCYTTNGANETRNVKVTYQANFGVSVTSKNNISEGRELTVECNCNATNVGTITWFLSNTSISSTYYTSNTSTCYSKLTIPSNVTTVAWNAMPLSTTGQCFKALYTPNSSAECVDFVAYCTLTNQIFDTVSSENMTLKYVTDPNCPSPYVGSIGSVTVVSCQEENLKLTGTKNFTCVKTDIGAIWNLTYYGCVSAALDNIKKSTGSYQYGTIQLSWKLWAAEFALHTFSQALTSPTSKDSVPLILGNLSSAVIAEKEAITTSANDIILVVNLLQSVETAIGKVETSVMTNFLQTVNIVVDNTTTWNQVPNRVEESSKLLQSVEKFAEKLSISGPFNISNSNVQLFGNIISNLNDYTANFNFSHTNNLTGNILINKTALRDFSENSTVISIAYSTLKDILSSTGNNSSTSGVINGLVMTTTVTGNYTNFQIGMDFKKSNDKLNKTLCVFWNFNIQDWDSTGCQAKNNSDSTMVTCVCDHLTSFSILMSYDYNISPEEELILTYISYIGLGISILSLVICIVIEATVWKSVTKNKTSYLRHVCIMNIAVSLLMADIWFIIGSAMSDYGNVDACVAATFFTHLFYLCTFFLDVNHGSHPLLSSHVRVP